MKSDGLVLNLFLTEKGEKHNLFKASLFVFISDQKYLACCWKSALHPEIEAHCFGWEAQTRASNFWGVTESHCDRKRAFLERSSYKWLRAPFSFSYLFFLFSSRLSHQHLRQRKEEDSPLMKKARVQGLQEEAWKFFGPEIARQRSRKRRQLEKASKKRRKKQHSCFLLRNCDRYKHFFAFSQCKNRTVTTRVTYAS